MYMYIHELKNYGSMGMRLINLVILHVQMYTRVKNLYREYRNETDKVVHMYMHVHTCTYMYMCTWIILCSRRARMRLIIYYSTSTCIYMKIICSKKLSWHVLYRRWINYTYSHIFWTSRLLPGHKPFNKPVIIIIIIIII